MVSTYSLVYADGMKAAVPIHRRFAIQQRHVTWGASPFAGGPALGPHVHSTVGEDLALARQSNVPFGIGEWRTLSGRITPGENLWLYALPNPYPDKEITSLDLCAEKEMSLVYAVSTSPLAEHPLRPQVRRKLRMTLPAGVPLNKLGELDTDDRGERIGIDLGTAISVRAVLEYSRPDWLGNLPDVQPVRSERDVIVEYAAHPDARLYLRTDDGSCSCVSSVRCKPHNPPPARPSKQWLSRRRSGR